MTNYGGLRALCRWLQFYCTHMYCLALWHCLYTSMTEIILLFTLFISSSLAPCYRPSTIETPNLLGWFLCLTYHLRTLAWCFAFAFFHIISLSLSTLIICSIIKYNYAFAFKISLNQNDGHSLYLCIVHCSHIIGHDNYHTTLARWWYYNLTQSHIRSLT